MSFAADSICPCQATNRAGVRLVFHEEGEVLVNQVINVAS